jgi:hypothetical protein
LLDDSKALVSFAKKALKAEMATDAGRVNRITILGAFLFVTAGSILNALQAGVRIFRDDYQGGLPSTEFLLITFIFGSLICVAMVGYFSPPPAAGGTTAKPGR